MSIDAAGNYLYNIAWECTKEEDDADVGSWLEGNLFSSFFPFPFLIVFILIKNIWEKTLKTQK